jgi:glycerol kinase
VSEQTIVAIDQGTTSTRAIRYGLAGEVQAVASRGVTLQCPRPGWVEQDPENIWTGVVAALREVVCDGVAVIGVTNQRETIILWDRNTGQALYNAIVWQDRRTAEQCAQLVRDGVEPMLQSKTGLLLDPYFSATKLRWLLDNVAGARQRAARGELAAGTIDSFLLWRLTGGKVHATDVTNASRTMLYDINAHRWDAELLALFDIPAAILPVVHANDHVFGHTDPALLGRALTIGGMAGDQQAALIGLRCHRAGTIKSTFGTGAFMLANIGATPVLSGQRLLTTPAYRVAKHEAYAMEGSIFVAGAAVNWLRDRMGLIASSAETEQLARSVSADHGVYLVPAFVGLGAPHWRSDVRAAITGLTLETGRAHVVRAALEAAAFQSCDLVDTMQRDGIQKPSVMLIDGGMASNDWFAQFLSDVMELPVERPENHEATAYGAALLAGLAVGIWSDLDSSEIPARPVRRFEPQLDGVTRSRLLQGWCAAIGRVLA